MNHLYKISVIIPCFNKYDLLKRAVHSAVNQDFDDYEIYIADDCSTDFEEEDVINFLHDINHCNSDIHYKRNTSNLGTVLNMNNAILSSNGEIIVQLSGDDFFIHTSVLKNIYSYFKSNDCDICIGKRKEIGSNNIVPSCYETELLLNKNKRKLLMRSILTNNFISGSTLYYRKQFMVSQGLYNTKYRLIEDYPFVLNLVVNKIKIGILDDVTILYNTGGVSQNIKMSHMNKLKQLIHPTSPSEFQYENHRIKKELALPLAYQLNDLYAIKWIKEEILWFDFKYGNNKILDFIKWFPYLNIHLEKKEK